MGRILNNLYIALYYNMSELPMVTIVTPVTYSRVKFMHLMVSNVMNQTYPHSRLEWLVVGDDLLKTKESFEDAFKNIPSVKCRYIPCDIMRDIGAKRNFAVSHVSTKIASNQDSDDKYSSSHIEYSVSELKRTKSGIVGCKDMLVFFQENGGKMVYLKGNSIHEGTMTHTLRHWKVNKYHKNTMKAEGTRMVNGNYFNELDIRKIMICIAHGDNTYDKSRFLGNPVVDLSDDAKNNITNLINGVIK